MDSPEAADDPGLLETHAFYEAQLSSEQWLLCQSDAPFERRTLERESASLGMNKDLLEAIQRLQAQCDQLAQEKSEIEDMLVCEQLQHNKAVAEMGAEIATLRRSLADCETRILSLELQVDGFSLDDGKEVELDGFDDDAPKLRSTSREVVDGRFFTLRSSGEQDKDGLLAECERLRTELARSEAARFEMHRQLEESKQLRALVMEEDGPLKDKLVTMMSRMGEGELKVTRGSEDGSRCGDDGDETLRSYEDKAVEADVWPEHWTHLESMTPRTPTDMYGRVQALLELGEASLNDVGPEEEAQLRARLEEAERSKTKWQEEAKALESALRDRGERIVMLEEELKGGKVKVVTPSAAFTEDERVWKQEVDSLHRVLKDQEHRISELEAELREEKAKGRLDADDFAQQMTDLRLELSEIVDEEKWRRSQAEDISVRRVKELENELDVAQKERTAALADKRAAQELMEKREQSRIEAESKVSMLEQRLKEEWDQASKAEERVRVLEELLQGKDEIKGLDIVEVKLAREKLAREKAEAELKLAKALEDCEALRLSVREVCAERDRMASDVMQLQRSLDDSGSTTAKLIARMERLEEELRDLKEKEEGSGQREQEWEQEKEQRERLAEEMAERVKEMEGAAERGRQAEERFEELQKELGEREVKIASLTEEVKMRMEVVEAKVQLAQELEQVKEEKLALETELSLVSERSKVWEDMVNEHDVSDDGVSSTMNEVLRKWQREVLENQRMAKELSEVEKVCQGMKEEKAIATRMFGKALESVCKDLIILLKLLLEEGDEAKKAESLEPLVGRAQRLGSSLASHRYSGGDVKVDLSQAMSELVDVVGQGLAAARKEVSECRSAFAEKEVAMQSTRRAMESELANVRDDLEAEKIEDRTTLAKPVEKMIDRVAGEMLHVLHVIEQVNLTAGSKVELPESMEERISRIMGSSSILRGSSSLEDGGKVFSGWLADLLTEFTDVSVKIGVLTRKQLGSLRDRLEDLRDEHETVRSEQERLFAEYERLQSEEKAARIAEVSSLKASSDDLKSQLQDVEEKVQRITGERERLQKEVQQLQVRIEEQSAQERTCRMELTKALESNGEKEELLESMSRAIESLREEQQAQLLDAGKVMLEIEQTKTERDIAADEVTKLTQALAATEQRVVELETEVQSRVRKEEMEEKEQQVVKMKERAAMLEKRWRAVKETASRLEKDVVRLQEQVRREKAWSDAQRETHRRELESQKQVQLFFSRQLEKLEGVEMERDKCLLKINELNAVRAAVEKERDESKEAYAKLELKVHKRMAGWRGK